MTWRQKLASDRRVLGSGIPTQITCRMRNLGKRKSQLAPVTLPFKLLPGIKIVEVVVSNTIK
ncbi:MAG: hypothetical protein KDE47_30665, partial [Caldilineaceae bacterium]|nr:hypothetical protein [Caldilineaceae bacterium]